MWARMEPTVRWTSSPSGTAHLSTMVAQTTLDEQVLARELAPLRQIRDNYPKYLLTMDEAFGEMNYVGIQKRNVLKWMLE